MNRHAEPVVNAARAYYALQKERGVEIPPGAERVTPIIRPKIAARLESYLKWCKAQGIVDALAFLRYRFACADHSGYVPQIYQLKSNKLAAVWHEWQEGEALEQERGDRLERKAGTRFEQTVVALKILTAGHEAIKAHYVADGQPDLCLAEIDLSGGYHPESRYCGGCTKAVECTAQLHRVHGFDVVSLRAGRLWALPREVAAAAVR